MVSAAPVNNPAALVSDSAVPVSDSAALVNEKVGKKFRACPGRVIKQIVATKNIRLGKGTSFL